MFTKVATQWATTIATAATVLLAPAHAQTNATRDDDANRKKAMTQLEITLPDRILWTEPVRAALDELGREPCDRQAIANLGRELRKSGFRREGANALVKFSDNCRGDAQSLRFAINMYLDLSDYKETVRVAGELIKLEPLRDNGYFLRAVGHERVGDHQRAIDDYTTALELFANKATISSIGYEGLARSYDKLGRYCDAALALEGWIAANPARNETARARGMISTYENKGSCAVDTKMDDTFPVQRRGNIVLINATINGLKGRFILDTGATFVSIKRSFAEKAKIDIEEGSVVQLSTANGLTEGKRGRAKTVQLKTVKSSDVAVVIQTDQKGTYGTDIDGLLGMSFLSRFNVTMSRDTVRISSRAGR